MSSIESSIDQEIVEGIKKGRSPVIIFGAGIVGEVLLRACANAGINVECFCDNNINKAQSFKCNVEVIHTTDLKQKYKDAVFLISAADIRDVVDQLSSLGYSKWVAGSVLLRHFDISQYQFSAPAHFVEFAISACLLCHDGYMNPDELFLRSVDIIITERCSLKCRDCSNLMQYYVKPKDYNINELLRSIDTFCSFIDEVHEFRVIGGEPFMNKDIHLIVNRLIDEPRVKRIVIYTNGTIVPKEHQIEYFKNDKVLFFITDYGRLSKRLNDLIQLLQTNNVSFYAQKANGWTDCAGIMKHHRSVEQQKDIFSSCCARNLATLSDGKLYRCPFSANAARLRAVRNCENDCIDILHEPLEAMGLNDMKMKIRAFLLERDFLETCDYCTGRTYGALEIEPAVQTDKPLEYELFGSS